MTLRQAQGQLGAPIQGVTLYSFTRAFHGREYDLEGLVRKVAAEGYGPGLEIIGFSSFRGFPDVDDAYAGRFRDLVAETGLVTTSLAINADIGIHRDRLLSQDELIEYMRRQIEAAAKLGFPIARVQISISPDSMEALAPIAERYGVTLALEVHADQYASHPRILALRDRYEKVSSPFLGFTMDWGATVTGFAPSLIEAYRRRGASEDLLEKVVALWNEFYEQGPPADQAEHGQRFGRFIALAAQNGRPDLGIDFGINGTGLFGPARVDDWLEIFPWIKHVHGKFFGIDEHGEEPSVPVRDLVKLLVENGYNGAISSEYEGWHWNHWQSPFEIIAAEQAVQRSAAENAGSRMVTDAAEARSQLAAWLPRPEGANA
ncbi:sugar phosphate isomerase/epimerase [Microbacterium sp.]|jgi:sugar phosphate isomerase/epimerase|uniref:sugar phosphate isomerase/epimerase family protein n=1 Tax=Microbacterium sp. TaxID=51671 RepID=UPI002BEA2777|nr:sugar phosphate isomerase/epimerase [Microbacterium sp.]HWL76318.1 sugar phosphate isomerase/epimerase [Microbacterium sp.]